MSEFESDFQIYQNVSERLIGDHLHGAIRDLVDGAETEHGVVPLVLRSVRDNVVDIEYDKVEGLAIVGLDAVAGKLAMGVVPPKGMEPATFVETCRDLNYPLQQPIRVPMDELLSGLAQNRSTMVTAVSYLSSTESGVSMAALHIPGYYMGDGYNLIHDRNLDDPTLRDLGREGLSTQISSALFDYFSGIHLEHSKLFRLVLKTS